MKSSNKLPNKQEKIEYLKQFGKKYVFPEKVDQWNKMVEDTLNIDMGEALKMAAYTMRDLEDNVDYEALERSLEPICLNLSNKSVIFNILLNYAKKGPDFLINTKLFRPTIQKYNQKEIADWNTQVLTMYHNNKILTESHQAEQI